MALSLLYVLSIVALVHARPHATHPAFDDRNCEHKLSAQTVASYEADNILRSCRRPDVRVELG